MGQREQADRLLRDALARLEVSCRNPDIPARERILQEDLLDSLVIYRPASRREFVAKIPALLRERIHPAEIKHLDAILVLCRGRTSRGNMIRKCDESDIVAIHETINDAAMAYRGVIPDDRWHEPYMSYEELRQELDHGVIFWGFVDGDELAGVMGVQDKGEVCLIRHAYVKSERRRSGIGTRLLRFLESKVDKPVLIGTWADATWAIAFYQRNGYRLLQEEEKNKLLRKYWNIPERQIVTSVVLANAQW